MLRPPLQARNDISKEVHKVCSKLPSEMLKEAKIFYYSLQQNLLTTDINVFLVGSYVEYVMTLHIDSNQARKQPSERLNQGLHSFEDQMTQHWRVM